MSDAECPACHEKWSENRFSADCPTCGGGALSRACPVCDGACGAEWRRAVLDSTDSGEAHWIGACDYERWIDEPMLPSLRWARLKRAPESFVILCDNDSFEFKTIENALAWLSQEEYIPYKDALADGLIPPQTGLRSQFFES